MCVCVCCKCEHASIHLYRFKSSWLKSPYNDPKKIEEDSQPGGCLSEKIAQVLRGVHDRDVLKNPPPTSPSDQDIQFLQELYGKSFMDYW